MTHRERILSVCRGEVPERPVWAPRLDLWFNANRRAGTLPEPFRGLSLREITDALNIPYHAVIPDFASDRSVEDTIDRGLGIYRLKEMPFRTELPADVEREVSERSGMKRVTYHTPVGSVSCEFGLTEDMRRSGATLSWVREHILKAPEDCAPLMHIFGRLRLVRSDADYRAWQEWVGDAGAAVAFGSPSASGMHHILHELMDVTGFFYALHDFPDRLLALAQSMEGWFAQIYDALAASSAEIVHIGSNYDTAITYPPFFEAHILPWLQRAVERLRPAGKLVLTHTDGENLGLMGLYRQAGFDIADSFCPAPMTKLTLADALEQLPGVTIWGGIPSVALLSSSMDDAEFQRLVHAAVELATGRAHIILGIADTTPAAASLERLAHITRLLAD